LLSSELELSDDVLLSVSVFDLSRSGRLELGESLEPPRVPSSFFSSDADPCSLPRVPSSVPCVGASLRVDWPVGSGSSGLADGRGVPGASGSEEAMAGSVAA
jgi:hypothetical protein